MKCGSVVKTAKYMVNNCFALRAFLFAEKLICCRRNRVTEHGCRSVWNVRQKIYETSRGSRLQLDLTQEELADRTELTKGYISQLENDLCSPSIATLQDILNILGVSLQEFFTEPKNEKVVYTQGDYFTSKNGGGANTWLIPNSQRKDMEPIILTLPAHTSAEERLPFEGDGRYRNVKGKVHSQKGRVFFNRRSKTAHLS